MFKEGITLTTLAFPVLTTTRLTLREVTPFDAPSLLKYLADERVVTQMGLNPFQTEADALDEINWYHSIRTEQNRPVSAGASPNMRLLISSAVAAS